MLAKANVDFEKFNADFLKKSYFFQEVALANIGNLMVFSSFFQSVAHKSAKVENQKKIENFSCFFQNLWYNKNKLGNKTKYEI